jgi:hypothetical protein
MTQGAANHYLLVAPPKNLLHFQALRVTIKTDWRVIIMSKTSRARKYTFDHMVCLRTHDGDVTTVTYTYPPPAGSGKLFHRTKKIRNLGLIHTRNKAVQLLHNNGM